MRTPPNPRRPSRSESVGHELSDARAGAVFGVAAGIGAGLAVLLALMWLLFDSMESPPRPDSETAAVQATDPLSSRFPEPRLQIVPQADLLALRKLEEAELRGYRWADDGHEWIQIPIERAMAWVAEHGEPLWEQEDSPPPLTPLEARRERAGATPGRPEKQ